MLQAESPHSLFKLTIAIISVFVGNGKKKDLKKIKMLKCQSEKYGSQVGSPEFLLA